MEPRCVARSFAEYVWLSHLKQPSGTRLSVSILLHIWLVFCFTEPCRIADFKARHSGAVIDALRAKNLLPAWEALEFQLKKGPPPFLRPGWTSPLLGKRVELEWLDDDTAFVPIRGNVTGWREAKVLLIEYWAT